ncbi:MAG TPA: endonuclease III [Ginsengibacter sp.]|nr:endonuclease III [Ginsengibacter sp.]HRP45640.1 endonuclease III [Ginsengibacter sp.]
MWLKGGRKCAYKPQPNKDSRRLALPAFLSAEIFIVFETSNFELNLKPIPHTSMTKKEKADYIIKELNKLYPHPALPLDYKSPYTLLIAVLLAARNTDVGVNKVTPALFAKADNPRDMVKMDDAQIREIIRTVFMSERKAKAIHSLSQILIDKFNGEVPADFEALEGLPGVGHKTASVVMSLAFNTPAFPIDTHIQRMMIRWGVSDGKNVEQIEEDAKNFFPEKKWSKLYLQITLYGREYSPARFPSLSRDFITAKIANKKVLKEYNP